MSSKKEEERNEKIIRGLMKLPPNRRCINCNSLGPQYVCTNFWTFVCIACSGIHREFTHRVKSVSMAKFTAQEVDALQRAGNQRARELFLKEWDTQRMRLPDSSNPDKIREFIKTVYVDKKYAGGRSFDKPPRDMQSLKGHEEDHRRASSYHSFSQSPPYEHQYEERRYGKQTGILTRKPGSDRGHYEGKISSFVYSPGRLAEQMYEDRFANESSGSRISDYSVSSVGDPFRFDGQSPNFHDTGYSSPPTQQVRDILVADAQPQTSSTFSDVNTKRDLERITHSHRTASSGSFRSFDSNSVSLKSANSGSLMEMLESETKQAETSTLPSSMQILPMHAANEDLFGPPFVQPPISSSASPINLFADVSHPPTLPTAVEQKPSADPFSDLNEGWATFDLPHHVAPSLEANKEPPSVAPPVEATLKGSNDAFSSVHSGSEWFSVQNSAHSSLMADQWHVGFNEIKTSADSMSPQTWNAFGDSMGNVPQMLPGTLSQNSQSQVLLPTHPPSGDFFAGLRAPEATIKDGFQSPLDDKISTVSIPLTGMAGSSFPSSVLTQGGTIQERKSANPFDLPYDSDADGHNVFLDMSSLQDALPNSALPTTFLGGLPQPWFPQNPVTSFIPSVPQGGLPYMVGQVPSSQLSNIPQHGPVSSLGGNPFA